MLSLQEGAVVVRPFRFVASVPRLDGAPERWREAVRRIEDLGFSAISVSEHLTQAWEMEATIAMMAAAEATTRLRIQSLMLSNDYRHPAVLHKALATIDAFSGGRVEIGLGAGWMISDYEASGILFDSPGVRIDRLQESVTILKGLFSASPFSYKGRYYQISTLDGLPKPVQHPYPPFVLGGGGRHVLSLAAREADIVSVHPNLRHGLCSPATARDLSADQTARKLRWVHEAAAKSGRSIDDFELQFSLFICDVTTPASRTRAYVSSHAAALQADPALLADSPAVLSGSVEQCVEGLQERRERYGFSCFNLGGDVEATAPLVARLAGT